MVKPLVPVAVNDTPTEKELAAAKAARIRLGYEKSDDPHAVIQVSNPIRHVHPHRRGDAIDEEEANMELKCPTGQEPTTAVEVEYIPTEDLKPLEHVDLTVAVRHTVRSLAFVHRCCAAAHCVSVRDQGMDRDVSSLEYGTSVGDPPSGRMPPSPVRLSWLYGETVE